MGAIWQVGDLLVRLRHAGPGWIRPEAVRRRLARSAPGWHH